MLDWLLGGTPHYNPDSYFMNAQQIAERQKAKYIYKIEEERLAWDAEIELNNKLDRIEAKLDKLLGE